MQYNYYNLTHSQKRIWYTQKLHPDSSISNIGGILKINGRADFELFEKAINIIIKKNDAMRLRFIEKEGLPYQYLGEFKYESVDFFDFSSYKEAEREIYKWSQEAFNQSFVMENQPMYYFAFYKKSEHEYGALMRVNHIICDGWSVSLIQKQLCEIYANLAKGEQVNEESEFSYIDYINKEKEYLDSDKFIKDKKAWNEKFKELNVGSLFKSNYDYIADRKVFNLEKEKSILLKNFLRANKCSLNLFFTAAFLIYLNKINGEEDITVGNPIYNRLGKKFKSTLGMFVSTIPLRVTFDTNMSVKEFFNTIKYEMKSSFHSQKYPYDTLLSDLELNKKGFDGLFKYIINYYNSKVDMDINGTPVETIEYHNGNEHFPLQLVIKEWEDNDSITLQFDYKLSEYSEEDILKIYEYIINISDQILKSEEVKLLKDIEIITKEEKQKLLIDFNNTSADYPRNKTIQELFEERAEETPNNIAVVYENEEITYKELNERANALAITLREKGVQAESIVGIMVDHSIEMIVGIIGILKSGGAYLPIDPEYPAERINYMLDDSGARILLTQKHLIGRIAYEGEIIDLNDENSYSETTDDLENINTSENLAYVIYTSGTTGKPKGVMITHDNVINYIDAFLKEIPLNENDAVLQVVSFSFDAFTEEIYPILVNSGKIVISKKVGDANIDELVLNIEKYNITLLSCSPLLLNEIDKNNYLVRNRKIKFISGGDILKYDYIKNIIQFSDVYNSYGPTEATVCATYYKVNVDDDTKNNIPIGKPLSNYKVYLLGQQGQLLPACVPGELCISGKGLARGYLNNEELTEEKFVQNPYNPQEKIYKTGDLARWLPDGNVEFLGRIDHQVKIRGFRIELGEIESNLLKIDGIKEALVIDKEQDGNKYLCAYLVSETEHAVGDLREHLNKNLPDYMIPSYFITLENMPLTPNGKIDRKALPAPEGDINTGAVYEEARNEMEEKLVEIWQEVLGANRVGINDNFFDLGGHSLKATVLVGKMHKEINVEIPLREIFSLGTIKGLSEYIDSKGKSIYEEIKKLEEKEYYEASSAQKRMYMLQEFDRESTAYNMPGALEIHGRLEVVKVEDTLKRLIERHETLRTGFESKEEGIVQKVHKADEMDFRLEVLEISDETEIEYEIKNFVRSFDLSEAPLVRAGIIRLQAEKHILLFDIHHIISDGVSMGILTKEFAELYAGTKKEELKIQYRDYAAWQKNMQTREEFKKQEEYWLKEFEGEIPVLNMPTDYTRPVVQSFEGNNLSFTLGKQETRKLRELAKETGSTMYMLLLSNLNILLSKYSGQEDIVVGSPIAGRPHADLENIIGMFVNTLAIRSQLDSEYGYVEYLKQIKEKSLKAFENADYQFEELVEKLDIKRDLSRNPLFDVMFAMQNMDNDSLELEGLKISNLNSENNTAKFDLAITAAEGTDEIELSINYSTKLYRKETIKRMMESYLNIVKAVVENREIKLKDIEVVSEEEKQKLLIDFNNTSADCPRNKTIQELFEERAEETPNNIAVVYENEEITYKELNEKANALAKTLREKGVQADSIVGIMVDRSIEMIVGIIGILKSGGAYLPIDPEYPEERINYMLEDSGARILLTQKHLLGRIAYEGEIIDLNDENSYSETTDDLQNINSSENLAYVIYTSGTTGKPKGVTVQHNSVINTLSALGKYYPFTEDDSYLLKTNYIFDVSVSEIFGWFLGNGRLCILNNGFEKEPRHIIEAIKTNKITHLNFTNTMFNMFSNELTDDDFCEIASLKYIFVAGEAMKIKDNEKFNKLLANTQIENLYGPTEATIYATRYSVNVLTENIPIGKPINNTTLYILDKANRILPIGVPGELCIGGDGLARGYLNKEELTAEKFIENPYEMGQKMYKTGDLARWLPDGNVEFLGRIDHQVKIRGFRIELGEIESNLLKIDGIKEALVIDKEQDGNKYLCAYLVSETEHAVGDLREHLNKNLPDYMIPSYFITLENMPLTPNGKIDRKALPAPEGDINTGAVYEEARNEMEEKLVEIWQEVLGVNRVGINDNFFDLGGHSLKATVLVGKMHKEINVEIPLREIFSLGTIKGLSEYIDSKGKSIYEEIKKLEEKEYYEASSAQKRMYMLQEFDRESTAYNMPGALEIQGHLEVVKVEDTLKRLIERHETLRTGFESKEEGIVQKVHKADEMDFRLEVLEISDETEIEDEIKNFVRSFDLSEAPLVRARIIRLQAEKHILLFDIHHIISDGVSMGILTKEFAELYAGTKKEELKIQYRDYAAWQKNMQTREEFKKQEEYWLKEFEGEIPVLNMPTDYTRPVVQSFEGNNLSFTLGKQETRKLRELAKETGSTMYMLLLSNLNILLSKYSGQEDIVVGSPIAGRPHADLENIIGMFVNTLAIRNKIDKENTFEDYLNKIKEKTLKVYENADYPLDYLVEKLNIKRDMSRNPLFDVMFAMQNFNNSVIEINNLVFKEFNIKNITSKFDISIIAVEAENDIVFTFEYCTKLYNEETIKKLVEYFKNIIEQISINKKLLIKDISILSEVESKAINEVVKNEIDACTHDFEFEF